MFGLHIVKREPMPWFKSMLVRAIAIVASLLLSAVVITLLTSTNPLKIYASMINGAFGSELRVWSMAQNVAILLCISLAVTPAFKMRFWNCGAEGQVLVGGLANVSVMMFLGDKLPYPVLIVVMILASVAAGVIWAVIPAIFKAIWNTNETLFTLMMNYVAIQLVKFFVVLWEKQKGAGVMSTLTTGKLPMLFGVDYGWSIVIILVITVLSYVYMRYSKQGYEIAVVGESENTARYIGINVNKVVVRTMAISGALCGLAGFLLVSGTHHIVKSDIVGGNGFTAIIVAWLAQLNPLMMILTSFFVSFLDIGTAKIASSCNLNDYASDVVVGVALFIILASEFFINYRVIFNKHSKKEKEGK